MVNVEKMVSVQLTESSANIIHALLNRCLEKVHDYENNLEMSTAEYVTTNKLILALEQSGLIINPAV